MVLAELLAYELNAPAAIPSLEDGADYWHTLCHQLTQSGRIWDFRDVLITVCDSFEPMEACHKLLGPGDPFERMFEEWTATETDDSTLLALLDILAFAALRSTEVLREVGQFTKSCLEHADKIGNVLLQSSPEMLKSRPVLLWTVAKASISLREQKFENGLAYPLVHGYNNNNGYPGKSMIFDNRCSGLPVQIWYTYVPVFRENPGWMAPHLPPESFKLLEMALDTAKELDDFEIQALCLQELAMRSLNPSSMLNELANLQKTTQLDMQGYLSTCLTKYLICTDEDSASRLRMDLSDLGRWDDPSGLLYPGMAAARDIVHQALLPSNCNAPTTSIEAGLRYYRHLDESFRHEIDRYVPRSADGRDPRDPQSRSGSDASLERERVKMKRELEETRHELEQLRMSTSQNAKDSYSEDELHSHQDRRLVTKTPRVGERPRERYSSTDARVHGRHPRQGPEIIHTRIHRYDHHSSDEDSGSSNLETPYDRSRSRNEGPLTRYIRSRLNPDDTMVRTKAWASPDGEKRQRDKGGMHYPAHQEQPHKQGRRVEQQGSPDDLERHDRRQGSGYSTEGHEGYDVSFDDETSRDRYDIGTQRAMRPWFAIDAPRQQPDLGPTVEEVPDDEQEHPPELGEIEPGPSLDPAPGGERHGVVRGLDSASQVAARAKRRASSPPVEDVRPSNPQTSENASQGCEDGN